MADSPQLVLIEWVDSGQPLPAWQWLSDLEPRRAHKCVSVGFLVQDHQQTKILAPNLGSSDGGDDWDQASGLITIPAVAITKLERLTSASGQASKMPGDRAAA
jgi:hypothetical protein